MATSGLKTTRLFCKPDTSCRSSLSSSSTLSRAQMNSSLSAACCISSCPTTSNSLGYFTHHSHKRIRQVINTSEYSTFETSSSLGFCSLQTKRVRTRVTTSTKRKRYVPVSALFFWASPNERERELSHSAPQVSDRVGELNSIADFTRFRNNGDEGAELQTAIITYKKQFPWSLFQPQQVRGMGDSYLREVECRILYDCKPQEKDLRRDVLPVKVDLVAAVHIADREYFSSLQRELSTYDRVLYEMVADKDKLQTNRLGQMRWRPPRRLPGRRGAQGFSIIGTIQRVLAQLLTLEFQLECMDYRRENWYHADLDYDTFQVLQRERGETFFSFARDLTAMSSKAITRAAFAPSPDLDPWRQRLLWVSRVIPMPLVGLFVIEGMCAPTDAPLKTSPEMKALLDLDLPGAFKVFLAKQITTDLTDSASSLVEKSVIIGERNRVAMDELEAAFREGCSKVAIFYGSGHLPDMDRRLRQQFGLVPTGINWRTAWLIKGRKFNPVGNYSAILGALAKASGWPLNRYQTLALLLLSAILAVDLWFWELFLGACNEYLDQTLVFIVGLLDRGWNL